MYNSYSELVIMTIPDSTFMMDNEASCLPIPPEEERRIVEEMSNKSESHLKKATFTTSFPIGTIQIYTRVASLWQISITFDPFMYLTLPLPSIATRSMTVTLFHSDGSHPPKPCNVAVLKHSCCKDLNQALAA